MYNTTNNTKLVFFVIVAYCQYRPILSSIRSAYLFNIVGHLISILLAILLRIFSIVTCIVTVSGPIPTAQAPGPAESLASVAAPDQSYCLQPPLVLVSSNAYIAVGVLYFSNQAPRQQPSGSPVGAGPVPGQPRQTAGNAGVRCDLCWPARTAASNCRSSSCSQIAALASAAAAVGNTSTVVFCPCWSSCRR